MRAEYDKDGLLGIGVEGAPKFTEIVCGIGWPDKIGHETYAETWLAVIGCHEDDSYTILTEASALDTYTLGVKLTDLKDQLLISRIFTDDSQPTNTRALRDPWQIDGLCGYASLGKSLLTGRPKYIHEPNFWPFFRDRSTIATIIARPTDLEYGYSLIISLLEQNRLQTRLSTPRSEWVLNFEPPINDILRHPLMQAISHCIVFLEKEGKGKKRNTIPAKPRYGDKKKRKW